MFQHVVALPPDPILGLTEAFREDPNPDKINLTVGVYQDGNGKTPVLECVKEAERRIVEEEDSKSYLSIPGAPAYGEAVRELLFAADHEIIESRRAVSADTPGGTGALRVAADLLKSIAPSATVWLSTPTWPNHPGIFAAAGMPTKQYAYYDPGTQSLDYVKFIESLKAIPEGDVILLHACCHNPTGMDPNLAEWREIAEITRERNILPFFDFAYQGFGDGLDEDAAGLRLFCEPGRELIVSSSFSKNFGLYRERVGALTLVAQSHEAAQNVFSNMKSAIRVNYSNPPAHGADVVTRVLADSELRRLWGKELTAMRDRIAEMRARFVETLEAKGVEQDFSFLTRQKGMFSYSGLSKEQVERLRHEFSIYIVGSGRINVAAITPSNVDRLCEAVASVL